MTNLEHEVRRLHEQLERLNHSAEEDFKLKHATFQHARNTAETAERIRRVLLAILFVVAAQWIFGLLR